MSKILQYCKLTPKQIIYMIIVNRMRKDEILTVRGCVKIGTVSFLSQSPNFHKLGLCYSINFL